MPIERGTSYFGVRNPESALQDFDRFVDRDLNAVLHTFSERDRQYYRNTMEELVRLSHDRDMHVYMNPWGVGRVFGGEALSEFPARFPESTQITIDGDSLPAACFNAPRFRKFLKNWIDDAIATGADTLFWDEPHWYTPLWRTDNDPEGPTCFCPHCQQHFREKTGEDMPDSLTEQVRKFRRKSIEDFLIEMVTYTANRSVSNLICVMPPTEDTPGPWIGETLAGINDLDGLAVTPFWNLHDKDPKTFVRTWSNSLIEQTDKYDLKSQVWIQGFLLDESDREINNVRLATRTALEASPDSVFMWGWDGCRVISNIACERPEDVWNAYLEELNKSNRN